MKALIAIYIALCAASGAACAMLIHRYGIGGPPWFPQFWLMPATVIGVFSYVLYRYSTRPVEPEEPAELVRQVRPVYPEAARRKGLSGKVVVSVLIGVDGKVKRASIVEARPKGVFEKGVMDVVYKWEFKPARHGGKPVESRAVLPIRFKVK